MESNVKYLANPAKDHFYRINGDGTVTHVRLSAGLSLVEKMKDVFFVERDGLQEIEEYRFLYALYEADKEFYARYPDWIMRVVNEYFRSNVAEGYTEAHDDTHTNGELCTASMAYIYDYLRNKHGVEPLYNGDSEMLSGRDIWVMAFGEDSSYKPTINDPIKQLTKAANLLLSELGRLTRQSYANPIVNDTPRA